ncbi:MAG: acyl carrier protein [Desulfobacterales bacterium]|nr:MAG: acyl carrier protein [Desulfobacterales bacterium]
MNTLIGELKTKVVETLNLIDIRPEDIDETEPLVGGSIGIDSIDVLELVMMLEKDYGIKIDTKEEGAKVFESLKAMADYIGKAAPGHVPEIPA